MKLPFYFYKMNKKIRFNWIDLNYLKTIKIKSEKESKTIR